MQGACTRGAWQILDAQRLECPFHVPALQRAARGMAAGQPALLADPDGPPRQISRRSRGASGETSATADGAIVQACDLGACGLCRRGTCGQRASYRIKPIFGASGFCFHNDRHRPETGPKAFWGGKCFLLPSGFRFRYSTVLTGLAPAVNCDCRNRVLAQLSTSGERSRGADCSGKRAHFRPLLSWVPAPAPLADQGTGKC